MTATIVAFCADDGNIGAMATLIALEIVTALAQQAGQPNDTKKAAPHWERGF